MLKQDRFEISEILAAKFAGDITPEQQLTLDKWLALSERNREAYEKFISGEYMRTRAQTDETIVRGDFIRQVEKKIARRIARRRLARRTSVAAAISIGVVMCLLPDRDRSDIVAEPPHVIPQPILSINGSDGFVLKNDGGDEWRQIVAAQSGVNGEMPDDDMNVRINVPRGGFYHLKLEDGTLVWLNAETTIEYPGKFAPDRRHVHISGEAYFEVCRESGRPFEITTADGVGVMVLGTKFNVNSYADEPQIRVTLVEGSVDVRHNGRRVRLTPDKQAVFDRGGGGLTVRDISVSEFVAWKEGVFDFRLATFDEMLKTMERAYGIEFVIGDVDVSAFGEFTLTTDRGDGFARVENIMERITGLDFRAEGGKVFVTRKTK